LVRALGLVVLLLAEILGLTIAFDSGTVSGENHWWAALLLQSSQALRLAIAVAAATVLLGQASLRTAFRQAAEPLRGAGARWPFLLAHVAVYTAFAFTTSFVFGGRLAASAAPGAWTLAWGLLALGTLVSWGLVLLPGSAWLCLGRQCGTVLAAGLATGTLAWVAAWLTRYLWEPLAQSTLVLVHGLLGLLYPGALHYQPADLEIGTSSFAVTIAPQCSGYEGLGLVCMFVAGYLWLFRHQLRFPHSLLLLPLGMAVIWLTNVVRIVALVVIGTEWSPDVAAGGFHSQAGWLAFNGVALGIVAVTQRLRFFARDAETEAGPAFPSAPYLLPFLALTAALMVTSALTHGFDLLYPLRVVAVFAAAAWFGRTYAGWSWSWSWPAAAMGLAVFGLWLALEPASASGAGEGLATGLAGMSRAGAVTWIAFRVVGSVVAVPFAEELAFRGYLTRRLIAADFEQVPMGRFSWVSFLVSSACFGALHGRWLAGTLAGMGFALVLYRRGRLADAVLAHATANALIAAYVLSFGAWSLWT
jgi:exosortase E/protease (VPEID-CTERM system)